MRHAGRKDGTVTLGGGAGDPGRRSCASSADLFHESRHAEFTSRSPVTATAPIIGRLRRSSAPVTGRLGCDFASILDGYGRDTPAAHREASYATGGLLERQRIAGIIVRRVLTRRSHRRGAERYRAQLRPNCHAPRRTDCLFAVTKPPSPVRWTDGFGNTSVDSCAPFSRARDSADHDGGRRRLIRNLAFLSGARHYRYRFRATQ